MPNEVVVRYTPREFDAVTWYLKGLSYNGKIVKILPESNEVVVVGGIVMECFGKVVTRKPLQRFQLPVIRVWPVKATRGKVYGRHVHDVDRVRFGK